MDVIDARNEREGSGAAALVTPFAEIDLPAAGTAGRGYAYWSENFTPFEEAVDEAVFEAERDQSYSQALDELADEGFDEAVAMLAEETEQTVSDRITGESAATAQDRERLAAAYLSPIQFEAEAYLSGLEEKLAGTEIGALSPEQLDDFMSRYDARPENVSPAGEEFIGALVRKAKKAVKFAVKTAGTLPSPLLAPILGRLRKLVAPLLRRVLAFAIGKLPEPLRPVARKLADRLGAAVAGEDEMSPSVAVDPEGLALSFDEALAAALTDDRAGAVEGEELGADYLDERFEGRDLERLAEARGALIDRIDEAGGGDALAPAIENFLPALLGALRLGIKLAGRPRVVAFLAQYLARLIGRWVEPQQAKPLAQAIADAGLRLMTLEAEAPGESGAAAPVATTLASVVEDTVRRLTEAEDYLFEDEELTQLAAADAFGAAVATHFPPVHVRAELQEAPSLGGAFGVRLARGFRSYAKYSRAPEIELTAGLADALPSFGGATLGGALRARGATFPLRARMHIYQASAGTTVPGILRHDRFGRRGIRRAIGVHPLTRSAAGMLLREPGLGAHAPAPFLKSPHRIAAGQRLYILEPLGQSEAGAGSGRGPAPSRAWISVNRRRARITVGFFFAEADTQHLARALRQGQGPGPLLQAVFARFKGLNPHRLADPSPGRAGRTGEDEDLEEFAARVRPGSSGAAWRRRIGGWIMPALAKWLRANAEAFVRAANDPQAGVTLRVVLNGVPGLDGRAPHGAGASPAAVITVAPGHGRA